jgi:hypothetical protein
MTSRVVSAVETTAQIFGPKSEAKLVSIKKNRSEVWPVHQMTDEAVRLANQQQNRR